MQAVYGSAALLSSLEVGHYASDSAEGIEKTHQPVGEAGGDSEGRVQGVGERGAEQDQEHNRHGVEFHEIQV